MTRTLAGRDENLSPLPRCPLPPPPPAPASCASPPSTTLLQATPSPPARAAATAARHRSKPTPRARRRTRRLSAATPAARSASTSSRVRRARARMAMASAGSRQSRWRAACSPPWALSCRRPGRSSPAAAKRSCANIYRAVCLEQSFPRAPVLTLTKSIINCQGDGGHGDDNTSETTRLVSECALPTPPRPAWQAEALP